MARKKKKRSPAISILIFVSALVIVSTFIYLRGKNKHTITDISLYTNASIHSYQNINVHGSRRTLLNHNVRKKKLDDAMWTLKPNLPSHLKLTENSEYYDINDQDINSRESDDQKQLSDDSDLQTSSSDSKNTKFKSAFINYQTIAPVTDISTTPSETDVPSTPITTQSDTTPIYTETPTSPITTESITTPSVTEPGEPEVTTEIDPDVDPNETLMLIRHRRGVGNTPTSPDPLSTSVTPPNCGGYDNYTDDSEDYYEGPTGDCECGYNMTGPYCSEELSEEERLQRLAASLQFNTLVDGQFNNTARQDFQEQLEQYYSTLEGFERIFVLPLVYDAETNKTALNFIVFFDNATDAEDADRSASTTFDIVGSVLPILIDNQTVTFGQNDTFLIRTTIDSEEQTIPLGSENRDNVCYIYNQLQTCDHGENRGECVNNNGTAMCECATQYLGEYCEDEVQYAPESEEENFLAILLPILTGVACAAALCSCCFLCCRRCYKAEEEASSYTESITEYPPLILPRYYPFAFKQFVAGSEAEEVNRLVIERPVIQPVIVERTIVKERAVQQVVEEAVVPVVREAIVPVVQDVVVPVVHNVPVVQERAQYLLEDIGYENAGYIRGPPVTSDNVRYFRDDRRPIIGGGAWDSSSQSNASTAITSPSMILPRFHPTPFKQFIPGSEGDEEEIRTKKRQKKHVL